jgi:flagellar motor switch protein FliM
MPKLKATFQAEEQEVDRVWIRRVREEMLTTEVEVIAELGKTDITSERLIQLKVGDTIMLGNDVTDPLTVKVQGMPKVKGFPGVSRGLKAIQVTEIIEREG